MRFNEDVKFVKTNTLNTFNGIYYQNCNYITKNFTLLAFFITKITNKLIIAKLLVLFICFLTCWFSKWFTKNLNAGAYPLSNARRQNGDISTSTKFFFFFLENQPVSGLSLLSLGDVI